MSANIVIKFSDPKVQDQNITEKNTNFFILLTKENEKKDIFSVKNAGKILAARSQSQIIKERVRRIVGCFVRFLS